MPVHGAAHNHILAGHFVEQDMRLEGAENKKEAPVMDAGMTEPATRPEQRMSFQQLAGGFHGLEVSLGHIPIRAGRVPLELALHVGDEILRLRRLMSPWTECARALGSEWPGNPRG